MLRTARVQLVSQSIEGAYINYVFKFFDEKDVRKEDSYYITCVRYPNWEHRKVYTGEIGYLQYNYYVAGASRYFSNGRYVYYKTNHYHFISFVTEEDEVVPIPNNN